MPEAVSKSGSPHTRMSAVTQEQEATQSVLDKLKKTKKR